MNAKEAAARAKQVQQEHEAEVKRKVEEDRRNIDQRVKDDIAFSTPHVHDAIREAVENGDMKTEYTFNYDDVGWRVSNSIAALLAQDGYTAQVVSKLNVPMSDECKVDYWALKISWEKPG